MAIPSAELIKLAGAAGTIGFIAGAVLVLFCGWRRLTRPRDEDVSALRRECRDLRATVARLTHKRAAQDLALGKAHEAKARLAQRLVEMVGHGPARKDVA